MTQETTHNTRVPELDGMRGLAILMVLVFHILEVASPLTKNSVVIFINRLAGVGWMGVDIFFVLSGFLITSILLNTRSQPRYFTNFYARRILRIFPLYFVIVGGIFIFLPLLAPDTAANTQGSWPYFVLYLQNWLVIPLLNLGKFPALVGPSWSLAIEEQFYLIWPALVFVLSRRKMGFLMAGLLAFSLVLRVLIVHFDTTHKYVVHFLYFSTITRFDGFAVGALLALAFQSERWKPVVSRFAWPVLGVMSLVVATIFITSDKVSPLDKNYYLNTWGFTLIALAAGALLTVITTGPPQSPFSRIFRSRALSFFGKYSYAMYLIHYPITLLLFKALDFGERDNLRIWLIFVVASFALTILGSLLTWHLIEKPALKQKKYFESKPVESGVEMREQRIENRE